MSGVQYDNFTDTADLSIGSHTGDDGVGWAQNLVSVDTGAAKISAAGRLYCASGGSNWHRAADVGSADYDVEADVVYLSSGDGGVTGRVATGDKFYMARYSKGANQWQLYKRNGGGWTLLGSYGETLAVNDVRRVRLRMWGSAISLYVDGTLRVGPITDSAISAGGRVGSHQFGTSTSTTGVQIDNLDVILRPATQDIAPTGIASGEAFGTASITFSLSPTGITSSEAFGTLTLTPGEVFILPTGVASSEAFGTLHVFTPIALAGIASSEAFGTLSLGLGIQPVGIASAGTGAAAFGTPSIVLIIRPTGIASAEAFGTLSLAAPAPGAPYDPPRDVLYIEGGDSFEWPINHSSEDTLTLGRTVEHGAPSQTLNVVRQQSAQGPLLYRLQGTILDPAQRTSLQEFFDAGESSTVIFHHAEGDEYEVILTSLDMPAEKVGVNPQFPDLYHVWRVRLEMLILHVRAGLLAEVA
jgi:hypothetical protein